MERQVREKIAYLKGLASGLNVDPESKEGRLLYGLMEVLDSLSASIERCADNQRELEEYVAVIDDDLSDVEEFLDLDHYGYDADDTSYVRLRCPECGDTVYWDEDILDDEDVVEIECPNCRHTIAVGEPVTASSPERTASSSPATPPV